MQVNQKNWSCPKKQEARYCTIIDQYRKHFSFSIPKEKQYWSMCGQCSDDQGLSLAGSEPLQIVDSELITHDQFRGVEINSDIHNLNVQALPEMCFINDDFYDAISKSVVAKEFNPGIVNADFPASPDGAASYIARLMAMLTATSSDFLLVVNLILRMRFYKRKDGNYLLKLLQKYPQFQYAWNSGSWHLLDQYYEYNGAGNTGSRTYMGSFIFLNRN